MTKGRPKKGGSIEEAVKFQNQKNKMLEKEIGDLRKENKKLNERLDKMDKFIDYTLVHVYANSGHRIQDYESRVKTIGNELKKFKKKLNNIQQI